MSSESPQRGQSLVEFALGLIAFLLVVFGILEFGRFVYSYSVVASAAREGARYGAVHPDDLPGIEAAARSRAVGLEGDLAVGPISVTNDSVGVTVTYTFRPVAPLVGAAMQGGVSLGSTARQYREVLVGVSP